MKAVGYQKSLPATDPQALIDIELPTPVAVGRDILVRVEAIAVNPVDTKVRMRKTAPSGQYNVLGWDCAGEVVSVGQDVTLFNVGDKVFYAGSLTRDGCNSEYHLVDERIVGLKPKNLSYAEAAALPLTAITAWELLFDRLELHRPSLRCPRPTVLVIGGAGGVGSMLIQLIRKLTPATIIATASRPESKEWVLSLGAHYIIDHTKPFAPQLQALDIDCISYVASLTHTEQHYSELVEIIEPQGKFALIDDPVGGIDMMPLKQKSISLHWEFMFTRSMFETPDMQLQHQLLTDLARLVQEGKIKSTFKEHFGKINAENLKKAHQQIESGSTIGKIVLEGW